MSTAKILGTYPVNTPANIKAAEEYFEKYASRFSTQDRIMFARELAEVQYMNGIRPCEKVAHYAHAKPRADFTSSLKVRDYLTGGQARDELEMIAKEASALTPIEVVGLIDDFDRGNSLYGKYDRVPTPFDSVFVSEKVAEATDADSVWIGPTSDRLSKDDLQQWMENTSSRELLLSKFDTDLVDGLSSTNGWSVFTSLPNPTKQVISRLVNDNVINGTVSPGRDIRSTSGQYDNMSLHANSASARLRGLMG